MKWRYLCVLSAVLVLVAWTAWAGEEAAEPPAETVEEAAAEATEAPEEELTFDEKMAKAHELIGVVKYAEKQELLRLIYEVGIENFLAPIIDDEEKLLTAVKSVMRGSAEDRGALTRADLATYLLKDKRPAVFDAALTYTIQYAMCLDKPYVSDLLFDMYQKAKDDPELRLKLVEAFVPAGSPNPPYPAIESRPPLDYDKTLKRFQTIFRDPDPRVRCAVVENLNTDDLTVKKSGVSVLQHDPDNHVRARLIDYYNRGLNKSKDAVATALRGLDTGSIDEVESAVRYCKDRRVGKAREPMFAMTKRFGDYNEPTPRGLRVRMVKSLVVDAAMEQQWRKATPDLIWMATNDADDVVKVYAAYGALTIAGDRTVRLGDTEVLFPKKAVEAEKGPMLKAFKAWTIRVYQGKGDTPEVKRLQEEAQIEFTDKIYDIAKQRIAERDLETKKRGLSLVMEIGPDEFAREYDNVETFFELLSYLMILREYPEEVEANRQFARLLFAFVHKDDVKMMKLALQGLALFAGFCDKEVCLPVLWEMRNHPDKTVAEAVNQAGRAISGAGYLGSEERKKSNDAGKDQDAGKPDKQ